MGLLGITPRSVQPEFTKRGKLNFPKKPDANRFIGDLLDKMGISATEAQYRDDGKRIKTRRIDAEKFQTMTKAMSRLKCHPLPTFYNTKFGVSPTPSEQSDHDISDYVQPALMPEDGPVIPHIYIRDEAANGTKPDDEKQKEQSNANHAKSLTEQSEEPSGMELLTEIAARFRGLRCTTRASVWIAGHEIILSVPDCVAATAPREIMLDGLPVMWPWDWDVSEELLEMARRDDRSFLHNMGSGIGLLRVKSGLENQVTEIIRQLRDAA